MRDHESLNRRINRRVTFACGGTGNMNFVVDVVDLASPGRKGRKRDFAGPRLASVGYFDIFERGLKRWNKAERDPLEETMEAGL